MSDFEDDGSAQRRRELVGALRAANFDISNLKLGLGREGVEAALTIKDLRMKVAWRETELGLLVRRFERSVGYKAPEIMESFLWDFVRQVRQLLESWEESDAAAAQVPGDQEGPVQEGGGPSSAGRPAPEAASGGQGHLPG